MTDYTLIITKSTVFKGKHVKKGDEVIAQNLALVNFGKARIKDESEKKGEDKLKEGGEEDDKLNRTITKEDLKNRA